MAPDEALHEVRHNDSDRRAIMIKRIAVGILLSLLVLWANHQGASHVIHYKQARCLRGAAWQCEGERK